MVGHLESRLVGEWGLRFLGVGVLFLALGLLAGCGGGGDTTIIQTTVVTTPAAGQNQPTSEPQPTSGSSQNPDRARCGQIPGEFTGGPPLIVTASGMNCATAVRLARQALNGPLSGGWVCAASTISCENSATGATFFADDRTPPGEQYCPEGLIAAGDDACVHPDPDKCGGVDARPGDPSITNVTAQNASCSEALDLAARINDCHDACSDYLGFKCSHRSDGAVDHIWCTKPHYVRVTMWLVYYGD
jgi:hypothetical protein